MIPLTYDEACEIVRILMSSKQRGRDIQLAKDMLVRGAERAYIEVARFITGLPIGWSIVRKCRSFNLVKQELALARWNLFRFSYEDKATTHEYSLS